MGFSLFPREPVGERLKTREPRTFERSENSCGAIPPGGAEIFAGVKILST